MKILHIIEAKLHDLDRLLPGGDEFLRRYAAQRHGKTTTFFFSDEQILSEALLLLAQHQLNAQHFYSFELDPNEVDTYPAIYLGIQVIEGLFIDKLVHSAKLVPAEIAMDYESESIVVSTRVKELLEGKAQRIQWKPIAGTNKREWVLIEVVEHLPEPIFIPSPVYIGANDYPPGTFAVLSDGRDVITETNISKLKEVGLATSLEVKTPSTLLSWRPRLVASGAIIHALQSADVKGLLEPLRPLIPESYLIV